MVERRIREVIRIAGVVLPCLLIIYGILQSISTTHSAQPSLYFSLVMISWLGLSLAMFLFPAQKSQDAFMRIFAYHLCAAAYVLFISDLQQPYVSLAWALLLLVSYIYMSRKGVILNISVLLLVAIADILLTSDTDESIVVNLVAVSSILIAGAIMIALIRVQQADSDELNRSKAQESLQSGRMNTLINNLSDAVININDEGKIELYNAACLNLLNTNSNLQQQLIDSVIEVQDQSGKPVKLFQLAKKSRGVKIRDDLSLGVDDEVIRLEVTASPVRNSYSQTKGESAVEGYILILRDITKAKSLEEERDEFISVVSHELRTPITIVEGTLSNVQLMVERGKTPPGTLERSLADAHEQILFLSRLVNDLSTLSRAERGIADATEKINIKSLIHSLYEEYSPQAKKKQLLFDIDTIGKLGTITTSHLYVRELLQNLITNAIKYTNEGSITLRATKVGKNITFEVKDTGIGISKSDQSKIFKKFYRSEDYRTRETGGTGLGLYVAEKLSRKLGTTIEVDSRLNHGSSFAFTLPADESSSQEKS